MYTTLSSHFTIYPFNSSLKGQQNSCLQVKKRKSGNHEEIYKKSVATLFKITSNLNNYNERFKSFYY